MRSGPTRGGHRASRQGEIAHVNRVGMGRLVPNEGRAGYPVADVDAHGAPRCEEVDEIANDKPRRGHQGMTHVVDHACERHSVEQTPGQEQEVCEEHPDGPVLAQQGIHNLFFGIENRPIKFEHRQIG